MVQLAFFINLIVTLILIGVVWYMQVVHLPLLKYAPENDRDKFAQLLKERLVLITFPLMTLEGLTSLMVVLNFVRVPMETAAARTSYTIYGIAFILMLINAIITFQTLRPLRNKFLKKYNEKSARNWENWNWVRTVIWTSRAILLLATLFIR